MFRRFRENENKIISIYRHLRVVHETVFVCHYKLISWNHFYTITFIETWVCVQHMLPTLFFFLRSSFVCIQTCVFILSASESIMYSTSFFLHDTIPNQNWRCLERCFERDCAFALLINVKDAVVLGKNKIK